MLRLNAITLRPCWKPWQNLEFIKTYSNRWFTLWHFAIDNPVYLTSKYITEEPLVLSKTTICTRKKETCFVSNVLHFLQYIHTFPVCNVHCTCYDMYLLVEKRGLLLYKATVHWGNKSLIIMYYAKHTYKIRASGSFHNTAFGCCIQIRVNAIYFLGVIF